MLSRSHACPTDPTPASAHPAAYQSTPKRDSVAAYFHTRAAALVLFISLRWLISSGDSD